MAQGCYLESIGAAGRGTCVTATRLRRSAEVVRSQPRHVADAPPSTAAPCSRESCSGVLVGAGPGVRARERLRTPVSSHRRRASRKGARWAARGTRARRSTRGQTTLQRSTHGGHAWRDVPKAAMLGLERIFHSESCHGGRAAVPQGPDAVHCRRNRPCARRRHEGQFWGRHWRLGHLACGSRSAWRAAARIRQARVVGRCRTEGLEV